MALTITPVEHFVIGDREMRIIDVTFDSSYPAGGEAITARDCGLRLSITSIQTAIARDPDTVDKAVIVDYDAANGTLVAIWGDDDGTTGDTVLVEVPDTTDLSAHTARLTVIGK